MLVPVAVAVNVALVPAQAVALAGCPVMAGAEFTVKVTTSEMEFPHWPDTTQR